MTFNWFKKKKKKEEKEGEEGVNKEIKEKEGGIKEKLIEEESSLNSTGIPVSKEDIIIEVGLEESPEGAEIKKEDKLKGELVELEEAKVEPECEECDKQKHELFSVIINGKIKKLCRECIELSDAIIMEKEKYYKKDKKIVQSPERQYPKRELVFEYGKVVRNARERRGLNVREFTKAISESEGVIELIERNEIAPESAIRKIEQYFGIMLVNPFYLKKPSRKMKAFLAGDERENLRRAWEEKRKKYLEEKRKLLSMGKEKPVEIDFKKTNLKVGDLKEIHEKKFERDKDEEITDKGSEKEKKEHWQTY